MGSGSLADDSGEPQKELLGAVPAYTITQGRLVQLIYAMHPPDLVIKPDLADDLMPQSFSRFEEAVMCGYEKACEVLGGKQVGLLV